MAGVWNDEYHDLYLLLLADVFMNYTIMCLQDDGLDPSHYVSAPGMFNSLYKSSGVKIKLMTDMDEYLTVETGIRGGMTTVSHRNDDPRKPKSYEDMNASYSEDKVSPEEILTFKALRPMRK